VAAAGKMTMKRKRRARSHAHGRVAGPREVARARRSGSNGPSLQQGEAQCMADTTDTFQHFKQELGQKVKVAKAAGMSTQEIQSRAQEVGDFLASHYDPRSPEQRLLKELWSVSDKNEQQSIANAVVKLVQH
jgi:hypothetical protein